MAFVASGAACARQLRAEERNAEAAGRKYVVRKGSASRVVMKNEAVPTTTTTASAGVGLRAGREFAEHVPIEPASLIQERAAIDMLCDLKHVMLDLGHDVQLRTSYIELQPADSATTKAAAATTLVLLPGFDSSVLEYRRLAPLLAQQGFRVLVMDLVGLGFTARPPVGTGIDYGPVGKRAHVEAFLNALVPAHEQVVLCGASLGGATAIDIAVAFPHRVSQLVLIDAQGFIDGNGAGMLFPPLDRLGVALLKSVPLRNMANKMAYSDKARFATEDALRIGRVHCFCDGWDAATIAFLKSGGYRLSHRVREISAPTLLIWGADDEILSVEYVDRFQQELAQPLGDKFEAHVLQNCGHVAHLEAPAHTAKLIQQFLLHD